MKPTQEQLNDPKWWDDYAKEGFDYIFFNKNNLRTEFADEDGVLPNNNRLIVTENAWVLLAKRPTKPSFVPITETKTLYWVAEVDSYGTPWNFDGPHDDYESAEDSIPLLLTVGDKNRKLVVTSMQFRPIKSERELVINDAMEVLNQKPTAMPNELMGMLYDAGMLRLKEADK